MAHALALHLVGVFANLLRDEERRDAYEEYYRAACAALEKFVEESEREWRRLHPLPSRN